MGFRPPSAVSGQTFDVTKYGAKGDGTTDNAAAFAAAISAATAAGGGTVLIPRAASPYMLGSEVLMAYNVDIVGVGRPTVKYLASVGVQSMFRGQAGVSNWGVRGLILDGSLGTTSGVTGLVTIGRSAANVRITDNEFANAPNFAILTASYTVGDIGPTNIWVTNNYIHDTGFVGLKNATYFAAVKKLWFVGNRVVNSYDDNFALISGYSDANDYCADCVVAFNECKRSQIASNIALTGSGHRCCFNICGDAIYGNGISSGVGSIRLRPTAGDTHYPYDITCTDNLVTSHQTDIANGCPGIYVEAARSIVARNTVIGAPPSTDANLSCITIRHIFTITAPRIAPSEPGELIVEDNQCYAGYHGIDYSGDTYGYGLPVIIRGNRSTRAASHAFRIAPGNNTDVLDVKRNTAISAGGDGFNWTGTWNEGELVDNKARLCTGRGFNIPSGTQTRTRVAGNVAVSCTAGDSNIAISAILGDSPYGFGQPTLVAPTNKLWLPATGIATTQRMYIARLRTGPRTIAMINFGFIVTTASTADDLWDFGVYDAAGTRLVSSGPTAGKVNSVGNKQVAMTQTLAPHTTYYLAMVGDVTASLRFLVGNYATSLLPRRVSGSIPTVEAAVADIAAHTLPASLPAISLTTVEVPLMFADEF